MSFGKTIKKLRREREMTQERLAEVLSVSPQAVSRWETDMAMPDISLIAPLCNLFDITSDELLGIDHTQKQKKIKSICDEADKYSQKGYLDEARTILEDGIREYPDSNELIYNLMFLSFWQHNSTGDSRYIEETIKLGEHILNKKSTEEHQRHGAIPILCYSYRDIGRIDEAVKLANSMPLLCESKECLLSNIYSGNKAYESKQIEIDSLFQLLSNSLFSLQTKSDSGKWIYTEEEFAIIRDKRIALLHLFFENGDFGFYHTHLCDTHREQAVYYAKKHDEINTLKHLQLAADHAIKFMMSIGEKGTSLVFRDMQNESFVTGSSDNDACILLQKMEHAAFDEIRKKDEYIKIQKQLSQHSGKWCVE